LNPFHFSTRPRAGALRLHTVAGLVMVAALGLVAVGIVLVNRKPTTAA